MRTYTASGRSRWPWIIGAAILAAAIIIAIVIGTTRGTTTADAPTPSPSTTATPTVSPTSPSTDGDTGAAPTGCLGGTNRDANMVLAAQKAAPHSTFGAVDVATSFFRWGIQYPTPSVDEANKVSAAISSSGAPQSFRDIADAYAKGGDISGGQVPAGTPFYLSTVPGRWAVSNESTPDRITVSVSAAFVVGRALSPTQSASEAFVLVWEQNTWKIEREQQADSAALAAGGTLFTAGC